MKNLRIHKLLLVEALNLVHKVLKTPQIPEDLRIELVSWRKDVESMGIDTGGENEEVQLLSEYKERISDTRGGV